MGEWIKKMWYVYKCNIMLLSHKNSETPVPCNNTDVPREHYAEGNKPGRER